MSGEILCKPQKRFYSIQGLRFVFSLMIVNYHFFSLYFSFLIYGIDTYAKRIMPRENKGA